jgi:hypothetical protein
MRAVIKIILLKGGHPMYRKVDGDWTPDINQATVFESKAPLGEDLFLYQDDDWRNCYDLEVEHI